jgi:hypothetical protein
MSTQSRQRKDYGQILLGQTLVVERLRRTDRKPPSSSHLSESTAGSQGSSGDYYDR